MVVSHCRHSISIDKDDIMTSRFGKSISSAQLYEYTMHLGLVPLANPIIDGIIDCILVNDEQI